MICAYCGEEKKGTKEHIISRSVLSLFPECYLTIDNSRGKIYPSDPIINDVCAHCNNNKISYIDHCSMLFIKKYFQKDYALDENIEIEYNLSMLQKIFLKYTYNSLRADNKDISFFTDNVIKYLTDETITIHLENVTILGGLAINTTPMPLFMLGNQKINWSPNPLFISEFLMRFNSLTAEITLNEFKEEKFEGIHTSYIFRFNTGQFIIICWNTDQDNIDKNIDKIKSKYPYEVLNETGTSILKRCTGYSNYHSGSLSLIDTTIGLKIQDEVTRRDSISRPKNGYLEKLTEEWRKEEQSLRKRYSKK